MVVAVMSACDRSRAVVIQLFIRCASIILFPETIGEGVLAAANLLFTRDAGKNGGVVFGVDDELLIYIRYRALIGG